MSRKNSKGKPTRKQIDNSISNIIQTIQMFGQKLDYLEGYIKSTEIALDLYTQMQGNQKEFIDYINEYKKKRDEALAKQKEEEAKKEVVKEEKTS
jgi:hypothetical protein